MSPSTPPRLLRRLLGDRSGNVAVLFALSLPMVSGAAAFGVETGYWYYDQYRLQQAADAAAFAAGVENRAGSSFAAIEAAAAAAATANGFMAGSDTIVVSNPPTSGPNQTENSVEVKLTRTAPRFFSKMFISTPVTLRGRAVATSINDANACVLTLDKGASRSLEFSGSSSLNLAGCNAMANSIADDAIYSGGSTDVTVPCLMTAGGVSMDSGLHLTACATPLTQLPPVGDPYRDVPEPAVTGTCQSTSGATLHPGRYCGGLNLSGAKTLEPGVYIIDGGTLRSNASASITASGVTFFLANDADVQFNGDASLNLSPPTTGDYAGMLFFGSRSNSPTDMKINGTSGSVLTGAIYFPAQSLTFQGDMTGQNGCTRIVAKTLTWTGHATFSADCSDYGMMTVPVGGAVRLSE